MTDMKLWISVGDRVRFNEAALRRMAADEFSYADRSTHTVAKVTARGVVTLESGQVWSCEWLERAPTEATPEPFKVGDTVRFTAKGRSRGGDLADHEVLNVGPAVVRLDSGTWSAWALEKVPADAEVTKAARDRYIAKQSEAALRDEALADPLTGAADKLVAAWEAAQAKRDTVYTFEDARASIRMQEAHLTAIARADDIVTALAQHLYATMEDWDDRPGPSQPFWRNQRLDGTWESEGNRMPFGEATGRPSRLICRDCGKDMKGKLPDGVSYSPSVAETRGGVPVGPVGAWGYDAERKRPLHLPSYHEALRKKASRLTDELKDAELTIRALVNTDPDVGKAGKASATKNDMTTDDPEWNKELVSTDSGWVWVEKAEAEVLNAARDRADRWKDRYYKIRERFDMQQSELAVEAAGLQVAAEVPICSDGDHDWLDFNNTQGFMVCAVCGFQAEDPDPHPGKAGE